MTAMTAVQLRNHLHKHSPLTLNLVDGSKLQIPHTDYAHVSPSGRVLTVYGKNDVLDIVLVSNIASIRSRVAA